MYCQFLSCLRAGKIRRKVSNPTNHRNRGSNCKSLGLFFSRHVFLAYPASLASTNDNLSNIYMLAAYPKSKKADLTKAEIKIIRRELEA